MKFRKLFVVLLVFIIFLGFGIYFFKDKFKDEDSIVNNAKANDISFVTPKDIEKSLKADDTDYYNNKILQVIGEVKSVSKDTHTVILKSDEDSIEVTFQEDQDLSNIKEGSFISVRGLTKPPLSKEFILRLKSAIISIK